MNDKLKSSIFASAALLALAVALLTRPGSVASVKSQQIGQKFLPNLTDPTQVASLEVEYYDPDIGAPARLAVQKNEQGQWIVASSDGYPIGLEEAATNQMRLIAKLLGDLEIINIASEVGGDHKQFGVVQKANESSAEWDEDQGMHVTLRDADRRALADFVIGKPVTEFPQQRFVRRGGETEVFTVQLDPRRDVRPSLLQWIDPDPLKLGEQQISNLHVLDYSVLMQEAQLPNGQKQVGLALQSHMDAKLTQKPEPPFEWVLDSLEMAAGNKLQPRKLQPNEQLNMAKVDSLVYGLQDLRILDVRRLPPGVKSTLPPDFEFRKNPQMASLGRDGFYYQPTGDKGVLQLSSNGQLTARTKDGIEYTFRFGELVAQGSSADKSKRKRYVMISAKLLKSEVATPGEQASGKSSRESLGTAGTSLATAGEEAVEQGNRPSPTNAQMIEALKKRLPPDPSGVLEFRRLEAEGVEGPRHASGEVQKSPRQRIAELNKRLADWYYVISEADYEKIHLTSETLLETKKPPKP